MNTHVTCEEGCLFSEFYNILQKFLKKFNICNMQILSTFVTTIDSSKSYHGNLSSGSSKPWVLSYIGYTVMCH